MSLDDMAERIAKEMADAVLGGIVTVTTPEDLQRHAEKIGPPTLDRATCRHCGEELWGHDERGGACARCARQQDDQASYDDGGREEGESDD